MQAPLLINLPPFESPLLESWLKSAQLPPADAALMRKMGQDGYLVVDLEHAGMDARAQRIIRNLAPRYPPTERRVMEAWTFDEDVRAIATDPRVMSVLRMLYQREPIPFQTLNFDVGTEQAAHSDLIHFNCAPRRYMCGVWVALEDIDKNCGPLVVYPGSHKLPDLDMFELGLPSDRHAYGRYEQAVASILREGGYEPLEVEVRRGQAIFWAANLFHGGTKIREPGRTRHSQATHYYFGDCLYYFSMESDPYVRRMCMREVLDIRTGRNMPNTYLGRVLSMADYKQYMTYERPLPPWVEAKPPVPGGGAQVAPDGEASVGDKDERIRFLRETVADLRAGVEHLQNLVAQQNKTIESERASAAAQRQDLDGARENLDGAREEIRKLSEECQSIALRAPPARDDRAALLEDNRALRAEMEASHARVRELEAMLHRLWKSRSFRLVHGIAKTLRIDR